jgi:nicotinamide mononucleotide transporter
MSIYGWYLWTRRDRQQRPEVRVTFSTRNEWLYQAAFFAFFYSVFYYALVELKEHFYPGALPAADAFASATAFTGMWLMARKKVESWYWWIATNTASVPLYFVKGLVLTSVFYVILWIMAWWGLNEWKERARRQSTAA